MSKKKVTDILSHEHTHAHTQNEVFTYDIDD